MAPSTTDLARESADHQPRDVAVVLFTRRREHQAKRFGLGADDAKVGATLLHNALDALRGAPREVGLAVVSDEPLPQQTLARCGQRDVAQLLQGGGSFEQRLLRALRDVAALGYRRLVLVGSDTPALSRDTLARATKVSARSAVIGPSTDGGFYLLAVDAEHIGALRGLPWHRPTLLRALRTRLVGLGLQLSSLATLADIDSASDARRQRALLDALSLALLGERLLFVAVGDSDRRAHPALALLVGQAAPRGPPALTL